MHLVALGAHCGDMEIQAVQLHINMRKRDTK